MKDEVTNGWKGERTNATTIATAATTTAAAVAIPTTALAATQQQPHMSSQLIIDSEEFKKKTMTIIIGFRDWTKRRAIYFSQSFFLCSSFPLAIENHITFHCHFMLSSQERL